MQVNYQALRATWISISTTEVIMTYENSVLVQKAKVFLEMMNMKKNMKKNKSFLLANLPKRKDFMI